MNCRWQALKFCLDAAVVVGIEIFNEFPFVYAAWNQTLANKESDTVSLGQSKAVR